MVDGDRPKCDAIERIDRPATSPLDISSRSFNDKDCADRLRVRGLAATLGYYFTRKTMRRLNEEREKGGLEPITVTQIIQAVRQLEAQSITAILARLADEMGNVLLSNDKKEVTIDSQVFSINRLKYVINSDGSEEIVFVTRTGRRKRILLVKPAPEPDSQPA